MRLFALLSLVAYLLVACAYGALGESIKASVIAFTSSFVWLVSHLDHHVTTSRRPS